MNKKLKFEWHSVDREDEGFSIFQKIAYHLKEEVTDPFNQEKINYKNRVGISYSDHVLPDGSPSHYKDPVTFWKDAEQVDRSGRRNFSRAYVANTVKLNFPEGMDKETQIYHAKEFVDKHFKDLDLAVTYSVYRVYRDKNGNESSKRTNSKHEYRAEFTYSTREVTAAGMGRKVNARTWAQMEEYANFLQIRWDERLETYERQEPQQEQANTEQREGRENEKEGFFNAEIVNEVVRQEAPTLELEERPTPQPSINNEWEEHKARVKQELGAALREQDGQQQEQLQGHAIPEVKEPEPVKKKRTWAEVYPEFEKLNTGKPQERQQATQALDIDGYDQPTDHTRIKAKQELQQAKTQPPKKRTWEEYHAKDKENDLIRKEQEEKNRQLGYDRDR